MVVGVTVVLSWAGHVHADSTREEGADRAEVSVGRTTRPWVSRMGHNIEYIRFGEGLWDDQKKSVLAGVDELLRPLKIESLRYPGGNLVQYHHWAEGIGPVEGRGTGYADWAGHPQVWSMEFGTDEFFRFAEGIGAAEAMITVNMPTSDELEPWMGTAQEAAAWVAYCNAAVDQETPIGTDARGRDWGTAGDWAKRRVANGRERPYGVKDWELGNEIFVTIKDPAWYAARCREFARAMKAVDPTIRIGVVGNDLDFHMTESPWNRALLEGTKGDVDFLIAHFYLPGINPDGGGDVTTRDVTRITLASPDRFRRRLADIQTTIRKVTGDRSKVGIAITEMACNLGCMSQDPKVLAHIRSQQSAVFLADTLLALEEGRVAVSNYWTLRGWEWSVLELYDGKIVPQGAYVAYRLFADYKQDRVCETAVRCGQLILNDSRREEFKRPAHPSLTAGATVDAAGKRIAVLLVNRALDGPTAVTIKLADEALAGGSCRLSLMSGPPDAINDAEHPQAIRITDGTIEMTGPGTARCTLPPCSIGLAEFRIP